MGKENDPKYVELLKQLSNTGVGPGKKWNQIKPKDVNTFAKAITENIRGMYTVVLDDLHKYFTDLKNKAPAQPATQQPAAQPAKTEQSATPAATPAPAQENKEQGNQVVPVSQKVESMKETIQKATGSDQFTLPFELTTDLISVDNFRQFLLQSQALLTNPAFNAEMGTYVNSLRSQAYAVNGALTNWQKAAGPDAQDGGFSLNINQDMNQFVATFAGAKYPKAMQMLSTLVPLFTQLTNMLRVLQASPTLKDGIIGEDRLRAQVQRGQDYVNRVGGFMTQIQNMRPNPGY